MFESMVNFLIPGHKERFDYSAKAKQIQYVRKFVRQYQIVEVIKRDAVFLCMRIENQSIIAFYSQIGLFRKLKQNAEYIKSLNNLSK